MFNGSIVGVNWLINKLARQQNVFGKKLSNLFKKLYHLIMAYRSKFVRGCFHKLKVTAFHCLRSFLNSLLTINNSSGSKIPRRTKPEIYTVPKC